MRPRALLLLPFLLATPALAGPGSSPPKASSPASRTVEEFDRMLADAEQRLEALIVKAHEDPRTAKVDKYLSYKTPDDFSNPRREVHVSDLADFMSDKEAPMALREKARDALKSPYHRGLDPDLAISEGRSKRVVFSMNRLVPLLQSKDEVSRTMAADVLDSFWHPNDPDILRYNPRAGNEKTWVPAIAAWRRILEHR